LPATGLVKLAYVEGGSGRVEALSPPPPHALNKTALKTKTAARTKNDLFIGPPLLGRLFSMLIIYFIGDKWNSSHLIFLYLNNHQLDHSPENNRIFVTYVVNNNELNLTYHPIPT
jgi:hypothetical protein